MGFAVPKGHFKQTAGADHVWMKPNGTYVGFQLAHVTAHALILRVAGKGGSAHGLPSPWADLNISLPNLNRNGSIDIYIYVIFLTIWATLKGLNKKLLSKLVKI